ncbi:hypothetical protein D3C73_902230 [compost metagenome]
MQGRDLVLWRDLEHHAFQFAAIGETLQAAAGSGPVKQHAVGRIGIGERGSHGDDECTVKGMSRWLARHICHAQAGGNPTGVGSVEHGLQLPVFIFIELLERPLQCGFGLQPGLVRTEQRRERAVEGGGARMLKQGCRRRVRILLGLLQGLLRIVQRLQARTFAHCLDQRVQRIALPVQRGLADGPRDVGVEAAE